MIHTPTHYTFRSSCRQPSAYINSRLNPANFQYWHIRGHFFPQREREREKEREREREREREGIAAHLRWTGNKPTSPWCEKPIRDLTTWLKALDPSCSSSSSSSSSTSKASSCHYRGNMRKHYKETSVCRRSRSQTHWQRSSLPDISTVGHTLLFM